MAEILAILGPVVELGKCIVAPILRQFNYLCCFKANVHSLQKEAKKLDDERAGLQMQVDAAKSNGRGILPAVETWLKDAADIRNKMTEDIPNAQRGCLALKSRYLLSKKAKKTAEEMKELRNDGKFDPIWLPAPPAATLSVALEETHEFQSRKQIEEDVLKALQDKKVAKIGICGMGGVGKTTMAKKIINGVRKKLFDEAVLVVVSQQADMSKIQREIAQALDLKFEEESLQDRARRLRERLTGPKRILIVLDDIWEKLKLEELGIPCEGGHRGCTTLLTSRDREVLHQMDVEVFAMRILQEGEAWSLFREKAGICVDDSNLVSVAEEVAKECGCLPVAIVTIGSALKKKEHRIWEDALHQLRTPNPTSMPQFLAEVYKPLYLSYNFLKDRQAESLFLFCCLFPEDFDISLEDLTMYGMGLGLFERVDTLEQARNRVSTIVELLKSRFLLLESEEDHHVKMHDVIRDVAIFIASEERLADVHHRSRDVDWKWISVFSETNDEFLDYLTGGSNFPNLCFLAIRGPMEIKDFSFLEGMKQLSVLSLYRISFISLPETIQSLENLRTLCLESCSVETISAVGELSSLEVLRCRSCDYIEELPADIGRLKHLKSLDISRCGRLSRIAPGIISKLVKLEKLKMRWSFKGWESAKVKEEERRNASLKELESLSKLRHLEIEIADVNLVAEELRLSSYIINYFITVGDSSLRFGTQFDKGIGLKLPIERINLGGWIYEFGRRTERLHLEGDGSKVLDLSQVQSTVKSLMIEKCRGAKKLVDTRAISTNRREYVAFPLLERLYLEDLPSLVEICEGPIPYASNSFNNLKDLQLTKLPALKHLWKSPNGLPQLESLEIEECDVMEDVFPNEENEKDRKKSDVTFPKLRKLKLTKLPSLQTFCRGEVESIEFPVLEALKIRDCPKLRSMVSPVESNQNWPNHNDDDQSLHLFCNEKVKIGTLTHLVLQGYDDISNIWCQKIPLHFFEKLDRLKIYKCNNIWSLFSYLTTENFVNLKTLRIDNCNKMKKVIADEDDLLQQKSPDIQHCEMMEEVFSIRKSGNTEWNHIAFPLEELKLVDMPSLSTFCSGIESVDFPVLNSMIIKNCPKLVSIVSPMDSNHNLADDHSMESLHLFCSPKVKIDGLTHLVLQGYDDIRNIWCQKIPLCFFEKLERLEICECNNMWNLFSYSIAENFVNLKTRSIDKCNKMKKDDHLQLKSPYMQRCEMMEEVSLNKKNQMNEYCSHLTFPKLEELELGDMPSLTTFSKGIESIDFPVLKTMTIRNCPKLVSTVSPMNCNQNLADDHSIESLHLFCSPKVNFDRLSDLTIIGSVSHLWCPQIPPSFFKKLESLRIRDHGNIKSLFLSPTAENLINLESLAIYDCNQIEKVTAEEMGQVMAGEKKVGEGSVVFPRLNRLRLQGLPLLGSFWERRRALELPSLEIVEIYKCPRMESWTPGSLSTPDLKHVMTDRQWFQGGEIKKMGGLNGVVRQLMSTKMKSTSAEDVEKQESTSDEHIEKLESTLAEDEKKQESIPTEDGKRSEDKEI